MDIEKLIRDLYDQKEKLVRAIAVLEDLAGERRDAFGVGSGRRGRKSMGAEERQEVSLRMKKYWAARRKRGEAQR